MIDNLVTIFKEILKFSIVATIMLWALIPLFMYILMYAFNYDKYASGLTAGIVVAVLIFITDSIVLHSSNKIDECNKEIVNKMFRGR